MKTRKGCWTCKARKLQCDGRQPTCERCARGQRQCQGYELRLSWPRDGDKKRAMVAGSGGPPSVMVSRPQLPAKRFFINTTWQDLEHYHHLYLQTQPSQCLSSCSPGLWRQPHQLANPMELVRHFYESAYLAMVSFDKITSEIRDSLLTLALAQDSLPGLALLFALLAFTSLHRHGLQEQAVQLKISALKYLAASVKGASLIPAEAAAQHVAASMFLAHYELGEWLWHVWGAMDMIRSTNMSQQGKYGYLLDWVYYHEALSRFAMRHWRHRSLALEDSDSRNSGTLGLQCPPLTRHRPAPSCPNPTFSILTLLSEICETLLDPRDPASRAPVYLDRVQGFKGQLGESTAASLSEPQTTSQADMGVELYQLATRVYLARATQSPWETAASLESLTRAVFTGTLITCNSCEHLFPLFILACEARRDEDRAAVLSMLDRTGRNSPRGERSIGFVRGAIQGVWCQQDLHADGELVMDYVGVVSAVVSASNAIPSFV
ncbi:uncharacterized protein PG998_000186 [Apiospora kogelbergensis]|uniref:uncharacterized protein n=1 Tax=Apiospora kogelbergensis TaxID=1337665 RepID=UPI00312DC720